MTPEEHDQQDHDLHYKHLEIDKALFALSEIERFLKILVEENMGKQLDWTNLETVRAFINAQRPQELSTSEFCETIILFPDKGMRLSGKMDIVSVQKILNITLNANVDRSE